MSLRERKKFHSVYTKYTAIFMAIIIFTVVILAIIISTIINNFSINARKKELANVTVSFESLLGYKGLETNSLESVLRENYEDINDMLSIIFISNPDSNILLLDKDGNILMAAHYDSVLKAPVLQYSEDLIIDDKMNIEQLNPGATPVITMNKMPESVMQEIVREHDVSMQRDCEGFFSSEVFLFSSVIQSREVNDSVNDTETSSDIDEESSSQETENLPSDELENELKEQAIVGAIVAYYPAEREGDMMHELIAPIVLIVMWVSLAAVIVVYMISYSVLKPIREIGNATKEFSRGKFDTRLTVRGNDELSELAESFNNMAIALDSKDEMQRNFLSSVSHDLRTPMTTISGFIDGILDGAIPEDKHQYYLEIIKKEVQRLSRLVTSLLDISRIQSGENKFDIKPFNICETVRQTVISMEKQFIEKELDVDCEFDEFDMIALGDKDAINRVVYNLCHNAIKFSYKGGKYLVSVKDEGKNIKFSVYNEGIGISKEEIPFVFDRFYKTDKSRGLDKSGAGLGLFISKTIIEAHGGKIKVESDYGKNCVFSFTVKKGE
ncbi:MAG: HAMP domain-containing histidine kinase [Clostridia bacterium]|nr:HAMP domain-containing histidine kinase [Clostridia bacterium]